MLDRLLALDGIADVVEGLVIDETLEAVAAGEAFERAFFVLIGAPSEVARHPGRENAVRLVRDEVGPARHPTS